MEHPWYNPQTQDKLNLLFKSFRFCITKPLLNAIKKHNTFYNFTSRKNDKDCFFSTMSFKVLPSLRKFRVF